jgi:ppGpp synthetase/RelA/SpoT-type nucleotidyltranferase
MAKPELSEIEYHQLLRPFERALQQIRLEFDFYLHDIGPLNLFTIETRLKDYRRATEKARRIQISIQKLQDLAGMRIVVATEPEVEVIKQFFKNIADIGKAKLVKDERIDRKNGYRSMHMVLEVGHHFTHLPYLDAQIEIQIPTILQHAFNFVSRAWVYQNEEMFPRTWRDEFASVSSALCTIENTISRLQSAVVKEDRPEAPLTPFSYARMVKAELAVRGKSFRR